MTLKKGARKENLNWKINYLAAKTGEEAHIQSAKDAAAAKYNKRRSVALENGEGSAEEALAAARHRKLETKLFQATRQLKAELKKSQRSEIQKQLKRTKQAPEDKVERLQQELELLKSTDLNALAEKTLSKKLKKHDSFKSNELASSIITEIYPETPTTPSDKDNTLLANLEGRLVGHKVVQNELTKLLSEVEAILIGRPTKKPEQKEKGSKTDSNPTRSQDRHDVSSSMFIESLQDTGDKGDHQKSRKDGSAKRKQDDMDWEDSDFDKYYNGEVKKNRAGQRERRLMWEQMYGKEAKHIQEKQEKAKQQRQANRGKPKEPKSVGNASGLLKPEEMHPSWQAKRQQQELMAKALSGQTGTNKKIVFNTDD